MRAYRVLKNGSIGVAGASVLLVDSECRALKNKFDLRTGVFQTLNELERNTIAVITLITRGTIKQEAIKGNVKIGELQKQPLDFYLIKSDRPQTRFQEAPSLVSVISMPCAFSSSRIRSASAKFLAFLAS